MSIKKNYTVLLIDWRGVGVELKHNYILSKHVKYEDFIGTFVNPLTAIDANMRHENC